MRRGGVRVLDEPDAVAARAARVGHGMGLIRRERAEPHAHRRASSLLAAIIPGVAPL